MITETHDSLLRKALLADNDHERTATFDAFSRKLKGSRIDPHNLRVIDLENGDDSPVLRMARHVEFFNVRLKEEERKSADLRAQKREVEGERDALKAQVKKLTLDLRDARRSIRETRAASRLPEVDSVSEYLARINEVERDSARHSICAMKLERENEALKATIAALGGPRKRRVKGVTEYVTRTSYTAEQAEAEKAKIDLACRRHLITIASAAKMKGHVTDRTIKQEK